MPSIRAVPALAASLLCIFRAGVSCLLMARDAETAQRDTAEEEALARPPLPRLAAGRIAALRARGE